jgi:hypothetical protein
LCNALQDEGLYTVRMNGSYEYRGIQFGNLYAIVKIHASV